MHEILSRLAEGMRVLDLGSKTGSFDAASIPALSVRLDLKWHRRSPPAFFVQGDAARLPFASRSFDAVIASHSLEHFENLKDALQEIGRVIKRDGALFVAVPDARTVTDRIYRWVGRGGGHVNRFDCEEKLMEMMASYSGLRPVAIKDLYTSLSFLNRHTDPGPRPKRWRLFFSGYQTPLAALNGMLRLADRWLGTRASIYGWAFYLGEIGEDIDTKPWTNVCVRCGAGHPSDWLEAVGAVGRWWGLPRWRCPGCGAANYLTQDDEFVRESRVHPTTPEVQ
ncbi:MAG: class I SAM-dependent methyltransferase [Bryobacteraceae bacterium]